MPNKIFLDEIVSITKLEEDYTIDISVSGNNLFFANEILTHNSGVNSTDVDLSNISDSVAISYTVDFQCAIITSDQLDELGQIMFKQLKNRWNSLDYYRKFCVGVDRAKMKLFNLEESAQLNISGAGNTNITKITTIDNTQKNKFDGFKF